MDEAYSDGLEQPHKADYLLLYRILRKLHAVLLIARGSQDDAAREASSRADGNMICHSCKEPYWRHATDPFEPFLHVVCNKSRVKL